MKVDIDRSKLFLRTLQDLEERINSDDPYVILGASALLRKLFLDHPTLVDSVNRVDHLRLRFRVLPTQVAPPGLPRPSFFSAQDGIDPDTSPPIDNPVEVTRGQFFGMVVLVVEGHEYTIADVIKFEANIMGAVHAGSPRDDKERALEEINRYLRVGGDYTASLRQLQAIGRVVLRTLGPLREKVARGNPAA
jgi:hypothetical protein